MGRGADPMNDRNPPTVPPFEPFPVDCLPPALRAFAVGVATANGCDGSFVAVPMLSAIASAIGGTRRARVKAQWSEPSIVWTAIVAESGSGKSPALEAVYGPLKARQREAAREWEGARGEHEAAEAAFQREHERWRKSKSDDPAPIRPEAPILRRYFTTEPTTEALAPMLRDNPRGLLVARDELGGLLGSFGMYNGAAQADESRYLEMWSGNGFAIDRRGSATIFVPRTALSIAGGIQPEILRAACIRERFASGLVPRFLFAMPPRRATYWNDAEVAHATVEGYARTFEGLYTLDFDRESSPGDPMPKEVPLDRDARGLFIRYHDEAEKRRLARGGDLAAATPKLRAYAVRIALELHFAEWAVGDRRDEPGAIGEGSMAAGIAIAEWFEVEAERVYAMIAGGVPEGETVVPWLVGWIRGRGGEVTARDLYRNLPTRYAGPAEAEAALRDLERDGFGELVNDGGGPGAPAFRFRLRPDADETPAGDTADGGCVGAGGDAARETDWGRM